MNQKSEIEEVKLKKWYFGKVILENSRNKRRKNQRKFMLAIYVSFYFTGHAFISRTLYLRIETIRMLNEFICNVTKFRWLVFFIEKMDTCTVVVTRKMSTKINYDFVNSFES